MLLEYNKRVGTVFHEKDYNAYPSLYTKDFTFMIQGKATTFNVPGKRTDLMFNVMNKYDPLFIC